MAKRHKERRNEAEETRQPVMMRGGNDGAEDLGPCPICARPVLPGASANRHHWRPKSKGGREWSWLHRVCHRKIHSLWTEAELARLYDTAEKIIATVEMAPFLTWVARKHPEFYDGSVDRRR